MSLSLRRRILLTVAPLLALLALQGAGAVLLLLLLGQRAGAILRENYESVRAMDRLRLAARDAEDARDDPAPWADLDAQLEIERQNLTILPREAELFAELEAAVARFREGGPRAPVDALAAAIRDLNEAQMRKASDDALATARASVFALSLGLVASGALALGAVWWLRRAILGPIRSVTQATQAIAGGQLHLVVPVYGSDELGRLAGAFNDMTRTLRAYRQSDTERLLRARRMGEATIDSFADPVVVLDLLGRVESANPAARRLLGVRPADPPDAWQPPEALRQPVADVLRHQRPTLAESFDQALTFREGDDERQYLPQVRPIRSEEGETLGAAVVLHDVTRFRLLDRLKSDWVATVSHELKTPLTSVRLAVHVLLEEVVGALEPKQIELLMEARDGTERLSKLIDHLLSLAKLEEGRERLELRRVAPGELLRAAAAEAAARAEDRRIAVAVEESPGLPAVEADAERLGRALNNLLDNALSHTEAGGTISLAATAGPPGKVCLSVSDTGIGIPPEHLPHVFDRFFRVPEDEPPGSPRRQARGTGLGLSIVREIVTSHAGEIECASEPGKGTTFRITLTAAEAEP